MLFFYKHFFTYLLQDFIVAQNYGVILLINAKKYANMRVCKLQYL